MDFTKQDSGSAYDSHNVMAPNLACATKDSKYCKSHELVPQQVKRLHEMNNKAKISCAECLRTYVNRSQAFIKDKGQWVNVVTLHCLRHPYLKV